MQKITVTGHTTVVVSTVIEVPDGPLPAEEELFRRAKKSFGGISAYMGNGGSDKLIGVQGSNETIAADEEVVFDDFIPEGHVSKSKSSDAGKKFNIKRAKQDVINYLTEQDEDYFAERGRTKAEVLADDDLLDELAGEHYKCVTQFGNDRDWSVQDACDSDPGIELDDEEE